MRVLLDECVDARLLAHLPEHNVRTVSQAGWRTLEDGPLIIAATGNIDVLVTIDKSIEHEQNWGKFDFAIIIVHVQRNRIDFYIPLIPDIQRAIDAAVPGRLMPVGRRKRRG